MRLPMICDLLQRRHSFADATTVLSRSIWNLSIYPAVDPLDSQAVFGPGEEHYAVARGVQKYCKTKIFKNIIAILGMEEIVWWR